MVMDCNEWGNIKDSELENILNIATETIKAKTKETKFNSYIVGVITSVFKKPVIEFAVEHRKDLKILRTFISTIAEVAKLVGYKGGFAKPNINKIVKVADKYVENKKAFEAFMYILSKSRHLYNHQVGPRPLVNKYAEILYKNSLIPKIVAKYHNDERIKDLEGKVINSLARMVHSIRTPYIFTLDPYRFNRVAKKLYTNQFLEFVVQNKEEASLLLDELPAAFHQELWWKESRINELFEKYLTKK